MSGSSGCRGLDDAALLRESGGGGSRDFGKSSARSSGRAGRPRERRRTGERPRRRGSPLRWAETSARLRRRERLRSRALTARPRRYLPTRCPLRGRTSAGAVLLGDQVPSRSIQARGAVFGRAPGTASSAQGKGAQPLDRTRCGSRTTDRYGLPCGGAQGPGGRRGIAQPSSAARLEDLKAEVGCNPPTAKREGSRDRPYSRCGVSEVQAPA